MESPKLNRSKSVARQLDKHYSTSWAVVLGTDKAILLNYIAWCVQENDDHDRSEYYKNGRYWWYHSLTQFYSRFPEWSPRHIAYMLKELKDDNLILHIRVIGNKANWYSTNGEAIDALVVSGIKEVRSRRTKIWGSEAVEDEGSANLASATLALPDDEGSATLALPESKSSARLADIERYKETTEIPNTTKSSSEASPTLSKLEQIDQDLKRRKPSVTSARRKFDKTFSVTAVVDTWKYISIEHFTKQGYHPIDAKAMKIVKAQMIPWCADVEIHLLEFLEWCITHWVELRDVRIKWPKLSAHPTFMEIYNHKDKFLEQYRKNGGTVSVKTGKVFTSVSQIPVDHPLYKQLKRLVETTGKAETL